MSDQVGFWTPVEYRGQTSICQKIINHADSVFYLGKWVAIVDPTSQLDEERTVCFEEQKSVSWLQIAVKAAVCFSLIALPLAPLLKACWTGAALGFSIIPLTVPLIAIFAMKVWRRFDFAHFLNQTVIKCIEAQLQNDSFDINAIDAKIQKFARDQFQRNYILNRLLSRCSRAFGLASYLGFGFAFAALISSQQATALKIFLVSALVNVIWRHPPPYTYLREEYLLQSARYAKDEIEAIKWLSSGANIYRLNFPIEEPVEERGVLPAYVKGRCMTAMEMFAMRGHLKVLAYLAILEPSPEKRKYMIFTEESKECPKWDLAYFIWGKDGEISHTEKSKVCILLNQLGCLPAGYDRETFQFKKIL